jgi:hypothetical protein
MLLCDVCGREIGTSHYHLPAEIRGKDGKIKFVHMECCSAEEIKKSLSLYAQNQIDLYRDIMELAKNTNLSEIEKYEKKYGKYEEILQGTKTDHDLMVSALISELRNKFEQR